ncbi:MAG TPA: hypothetical protein VEY33_15020 [Gemmatimonadota bacterium]|nr:hypothetical protein [Gemmatimonadota bacterium]
MHVPFDVSAPEAIPQGVLGKIDPDGSTTLYLEDLDLRIAMRNHRPYQVKSKWGFGFLLFPMPLILPVPARVAEPSSSEAAVPHVIFLTFDPREEGFTFDPGAVTVTSDDGADLSMEAFIGPVDGSCTGTWAGSETVREFALNSLETTCFGLQFPMQISPDIGFHLNLSGLSQHGEPTLPLALRFAKFSGNTDE